jgi:predicted aspartyl protease
MNWTHFPRSALASLAVSLAACDSVLHREINSRQQQKLGVQTLNADESRRRLAGAGTNAISITGPDTVTLPLLPAQGFCPVIRVAVNGAKPQPFLLDTGATFGVFQARTAIEHRVPVLDPSVWSIRSKGIGGTEMFKGSFVNLSVGEMQFVNIPQMVRQFRNDLPVLGSWVTESLDVDILGINPLARICTYMIVDYPARRVTFAKGHLFSQRPGSTPIPLIWKNNLPYVKLYADGVSWDALVDTGSAFGIEVTRSVAQQLRIDTQSVPALDTYQFGIGGGVDVRKAGINVSRITVLEGLGPALVNQPVGIRPDIALIGSSFLKNFRLVIDFRRNAMFLDRF